ncbi:nitrate reductase molybdenum cofactor assembly chaperone [Leucobacter viscericola]|uniref:Nitrate reductase molybdenum cofactor assembly chaperone n=1 Tax=Leucobacter viscericola TaxID=2714935 RepID=A0A6G7XDN3_9MICO|nr:nitrate reductase molybdenum cofactor assembly chaperone [Leucobacter viscericola]QIK62507.1 nitrate reductase molybdenum cofactor assembly chaperone [Leucobacter viscericola]
MSSTRVLGPLRQKIAPERLEIVAMDQAQRSIAHIVASHLLDYPSAEYEQQLPRLEKLVAQLPEPVAAAFQRYFDAQVVKDTVQRQKEYVTTFDLKRKCCLYLSYYAAGDTRRRGMALVTFQEAYRAAGWEFDAPELPDFLPVVLEFSALSDSPIAQELLAAHREGIEVLRAGLREYESPYAFVVEAICLTLPEMDPGTRERYLDLINEGPPTETVGVSFLGALKPFSQTDPNREEVLR